MQEIIDADETQNGNEAPFVQQTAKNYVVATDIEVLK